MAKIVLVAAAALIDKDGYVLMAERLTGIHAGKYEFPGGKIEAGETPEVALIRELHEELGIKTWESCLAPIGFASYPSEKPDGSKFHLLMPLFAIRKWEGYPKGLEGQKLKWVKPMDMMQVDMLPADIPLAAQLRDLIG